MVRARGKGGSGRDHGSIGLTPKERRRSWPVTAVGFLLLLQAAGLFGLGLLHFVATRLLENGVLEQLLQQDSGRWFLSGQAKAWAIGLLGVVNEEVLSRMSGRSFSIMGLLFSALSVIALLAAVGFLRVRRNAWTHAMLVQGLSLLLALILYFRGRPFHVYIVMLYSIFMVLYLNYHDVRVVFQRKQDIRGQRPARRRGVR